MAHRITLIITEDKINLNLNIPHFYENNYLVIPTDDDGWETEMIDNICDCEQFFDKIFDIFFNNFYKDDIENGLFEDLTCDMNTFESLWMLELVERLKLSNFLIIHYSEVDFKFYENYIGFENKKYLGEGKSWTKFCTTGIKTTDYWRYESCKKKYLKSIQKQ